MPHRRAWPHVPVSAAVRPAPARAHPWVLPQHLTCTFEMHKSLFLPGDLKQPAIYLETFSSAAGGDLLARMLEWGLCGGCGARPAP